MTRPYVEGKLGAANLYRYVLDNRPAPPLRGQAGSLTVATAGAIALY